MWIFCLEGYYSVVQKPGDDPDTLTVRARQREDLERLAEQVPLIEPISSGTGTDYPHRLKVDRKVFATWLSAQVLTLDYGNFKSAVAANQGHGRAYIYHKIWYILLELENAASDVFQRSLWPRNPKKLSK